MRIGPSFIGAIVGGVVGVAAQIGLESFVDREATWFAVVIGVLTGLGARAMAGDGIRTASYFRAGLAALVGLAAIVGGSYAASEVVRKKNMDAYESAPKAPTRSVDAEPDGASAESDLETPAANERKTGGDEAEEAASAETGEADATDDTADNGPAVDDTAEDSAPDTDSADATADQSSDQPADEEQDAARPAPTIDMTALEQAKRMPAERPAISPWQFAFFAIGTFLAYELARGGGKTAHSPAQGEV
jgi:hypothetical protein